MEARAARVHEELQRKRQEVEALEELGGQGGQGGAGGGAPKVSSTGCGICASSSPTDSSASASPGASPYSSVSSWRSSSCDLVFSSSEIAAGCSCTLLRLAIAFLSLHRRDQHVVACGRRVRFVSNSNHAVARPCTRCAATHTSLAPPRCALGRRMCCFLNCSQSAPSAPAHQRK